MLVYFSSISDFQEDSNKINCENWNINLEVETQTNF